MRIKQQPGALALFLLLPLALTAQGLPPAPPEIGDSLLSARFQSRDTYSHVTYLIRGDGTFTRLTADNRTVFWNIPSHEFSDHGGDASSGTYTYVYTPETQRATLTLNSGTFSSSYPIGFAVPFSIVTLYPRETTPNPRANVSLRARVTSTSTAIGGFVVDDTQWVLLRVAGPALAKFNVPEVCSAPIMTLYSQDQRMFDVRGWNKDANTPGALEATFELVGAFAFDRGSADCALLRIVGPGNYTIHANAAPGATEGDVLIEVYYLPY